MINCRCQFEHSFRPRGTEFTRILDPRTFPDREYSLHTTWKGRHWGQLKLLLSEIEFLTPYHGWGYHVIYAGAAPGVHIPILADMFPTMHFILIDPHPSMIVNGQYANIEVIQDMMTDDLARELCSRPWQDKILFISDIRIGPTLRREPDDVQQERIHRDMLSQRGWVKILQPVCSMLKFRLPWDGTSTSYLDGTVFFPVYGKDLTHEARLCVPKGANVVDYDNKLYETQMAYFNQRFRPAMYHFAGKYKCFDCSSFRWIVAEYLKAAAMTHDSHAIDRQCVIIEITLFRFKQLYNKRLRRECMAVYSHNRQSSTTDSALPSACAMVLENT